MVWYDCVESVCTFMTVKGKLVQKKLKRLAHRFTWFSMMPTPQIFEKEKSTIML